MTQSNNPGGQNVNQTAGGDKTGVNAGGRQTIRDITIYKQDLDAAGAVISAPLKAALVEVREGIEKAGIDAALKPMLIEQFDKLTDELKKGQKKNPSVVNGLWTMFCSAAKAIPTAVAVCVALVKLRPMLGH